MNVRHIALPADVADMIEAAKAGDTRALGRLYGMAGALVRVSAEVPEPLAGLIAARLAALCNALTAEGRGDYRGAVVAAALPWNRRGPKRGTARRRVLQEQAAVVADMAARDPKRSKLDAQLEAGERIAAARVPSSVGTLRRAQTRNRTRMKPK